MKRKMRLVALLTVLAMVFALQTCALAQENAQGGAGQAPASGQQAGRGQAQGQAQGQNQAASAPVDQPGAWALEGVNWAAIYGLADQPMLSKYASGITMAELYGVACNIYEKITGKPISPAEDGPFTDAGGQEAKEAWAIGILTDDNDYNPGKTAYRKEVISILFDTLKAANVGPGPTADAGAQVDPVRYFVSGGMLKGRQPGRLDLDKPCSRQELLVFAWRVYEYAAYETGNDSKGLLWKASDADSTVYLLGSIHFAHPSIYPLSRKMLEAYDKADYLVVEADIANQAEGIKYMQSKMMFTGDDTLEKSIPRELYDKFVEVIKPLNLAPGVYNKLKPWYAAMLVQGTQMLQGSMNANIGIDMYFLSKAAGRKEIKEIEGIKFQVDMFDSFSKEIQTWYLETALASATDGRQQASEGQQEPADSRQQDANRQHEAAGNQQQVSGGQQQAAGDQQQAAGDQQQAANVLAELLASWKKGDPAVIEKLLALEESAMDAEAKEFNRIFWATRNNNMFEKTRGYLADPAKKTYFIVAGAGHMGGGGGIITQLKEAGISVEQVK